MPHKTINQQFGILLYCWEPPSKIGENISVWSQWIVKITATLF